MCAGALFSKLIRGMLGTLLQRLGRFMFRAVGTHRLLAIRCEFRLPVALALLLLLERVLFVVVKVPLWVSYKQYISMKNKERGGRGESAYRRRSPSGQGVHL